MSRSNICTVPVGHFLFLIGLIFLPDQCNSARILFSMSVKTVSVCIIVSGIYCFGLGSIFGLLPRLFPSRCPNSWEGAWKRVNKQFSVWIMAYVGTKGTLYYYLRHHWFYSTHLTHLAFPPETIWCLPLSCCTASLAWMFFSIADTYVPAHTKIDQDTQYSSGREQSSSAERGESLPMD